jgi:hypothetical protein
VKHSYNPFYTKGSRLEREIIRPNVKSIYPALVIHVKSDMTLMLANILCRPKSLCTFCANKIEARNTIRADGFYTAVWLQRLQVTKALDYILNKESS